jgi:Chaperone of endosialidase
MKPNTLSLVLFALLTYFATMLGMEAVVPSPDGGYPSFNTAEGQKSLFSLTSGVASTALGWYSLFSNTDGSFNTAVGAGTLVLNVGDQTTGEGLQNTAVGTAALLFNSTGAKNTAVGSTALENNDTGLNNTAVGAAALLHNDTGQGNTAIGFDALLNNTTGNFNIALGVFAGFQQITGNGNVYIGVNGGIPGESNACYIKSIFASTSALGAPVLINSDNKLGTLPSSKRFKQDIKAMDKASDALFALKPVTFRYKKEIDPAGKSQLGLVAEEVEKVNPDLVVRDKEGKPYSVRYEQINAMLLNEFLKEHRKNEQQRKDFEAAIAQQQKQMEALTAGLQKVSAQLAAASPSRGGLEATKPAPQVVNNNQ